MVNFFLVSPTHLKKHQMLFETSKSFQKFVSVGWAKLFLLLFVTV